MLSTILPSNSDRSACSYVVLHPDIPKTPPMIPPQIMMLQRCFLPDLVERIGGVGNQLTQKDLLVGVEGVDDEGHQLLDVRIERESFRHDGLFFR